MDKPQHPGATAAVLQKHRDELFIALQRLLPQHGLSRLLGRIAASERPWIKDFLIRQAIDHYGIDLSEAQVKDASAYPSFNAFFTRYLTPHARPVDTREDALVSPADGTVSQIGPIAEGDIFQAKGHSFTVANLIGGDRETADRFRHGSFATIYLSPRDYHRVHMPVTGVLKNALYIPGKLFSVNDVTANHVDGVFARNERLCCLFDTDRGLVAVVMVGALFVAGIETVWQKAFIPGKRQGRIFNEGYTLKKGDELGAFRFGSTAIVVSETPLCWEPGFTPGAACRMGEALGLYRAG